MKLLNHLINIFYRFFPVVKLIYALFYTHSFLDVKILTGSSMPSIIFNPAHGDVSNNIRDEKLKWKILCRGLHDHPRVEGEWGLGLDGGSLALKEQLICLLL